MKNLLLIESAAYLHKLIPHGCEDIQQNSLFQAHAAMLHRILFQHTIPCGNHLLHPVNSKLKLAGHHISNLGVRMMMKGTYASLFKMGGGFGCRFDR